MKIVDVRATPVNIPYTAPYVFSHGSVASLTKTIVEVVTDEGATGLGEIADGDRAADLLAWRERLIGLDIRDFATMEARCLPGTRYTPWGNVAGALRVFGGLETALWDARARLEGVPLHLLLGGAVRTEIRLSEYFGFRRPGATEPGESTPLEIARYCARMVERHEAEVFEGKVATVGLDEEVVMVREIRAAIGERELRLDANGGWTVPTAREALRRLDPFVIHYYEDPVETYEEMAQLRTATRASFSTHVIDLDKAVRLRAPDTIVTNLNDLGGIRRVVAFIRACESFNVGFRFHSGETGVGSAAYLHVSAAMDHVREPSQTLFRWYAADVIAEGTFVPKRGRVAVPTGPGLGVTLDRKALQRCHERYLVEGQFPASKGGRAFRDRFMRV
ncbi:MAG: chloromuconate cycloisomerase [Alphaproteobacteria bacterium]|nr:chloromuconate cycloisomerase [Alphaproteobacteria bacterium]